MLTTKSRWVTIVVAALLSIPPIGVSHAHDTIDVSLGAAQACWADTDNEDAIFRQDNLLVALAPTQVNCQIPSHNNKKLDRVIARITRVQGFSGRANWCRLVSVSAFTNNTRQALSVVPEPGKTIGTLRLWKSFIPRNPYAKGYWQVRCRMEKGTVLRGIRYVYK